MKMEKEKTLTEKELYNLIKEEMADNELVVAFCEKKIGQIEKKNASAKKGSSEEDMAITDLLIEELGKIGKPVTISDLMASSEVIKGYVLENERPLTSQKITHLLKSTDKVVNTKEKKNSYYSLATEEETTEEVE